MGRVRALPESLVALISAGEVIENPSSIVKELIENSLDAGADRIEIEVRAGGIDYISVSDNGSGILREDCEVCLQRYSTSKISSREDIDAITTYGFRGEALASIASVAEMKIDTKAAEEEVGTTIHSRESQSLVIAEGGRPGGTRVEVYNLFERVPVRRKHLSSIRVENSRIHETVMKHAVVRPEIGFRLIRDNETVIDCPPNQDPVARIASLWGHDIAGALVQVNHSKSNIGVKGFVVRPPVARGNRSREYFSVLKRPIVDSQLSEAVESVYRTLLMKGQYPVFALDIVVDLADVDANVHPTKREVRILQLDEVVETLKEAVRGALFVKPETSESTSLEEHFGPTNQASQVTVKPALEEVVDSEETEADAVQLYEQSLLEPSVVEDQGVEVEFLKGVYRVIGQLSNLYILLESEEGLLIVDQHAAHERVLYERLRQDIDQQTLHVQELLEPIILSLSTNEIEFLSEIAGVLEEVGYTVEPFGGNEVAISTLPEVFGRRADETELLSFLGRAAEVGHETAREIFMDELVKLTACHSAIRAGQSLGMEEMRDLITQLAATTRKYNCCHGRPSMIRLRKDDIDKAVGRHGPEAIKRFRARHGLD